MAHRRQPLPRAGGARVRARFPRVHQRHQDAGRARASDALPLGRIAAALALAVSLQLTLAAQDPPAKGSKPAEPNAIVGLAYVFRADLAHARRAGWVAAETDDETLLTAIEATLRQRVRSVGMFAEARVERDPDAHFAVTFVGNMGKAYDRLLEVGLSDANRLQFRPVAIDTDLVDSSLRAERERLNAWRANAPEAPVTFFNSVPRDRGGPHPALRWVTRSGATAGPALPIAVLRRAVWPLLRADVDGVPRPTRHGERLVLEATLTEDAVARFRAWRAGRAGRTLVLLRNDRVVAERENNLIPASPTEESRVLVEVGSVEGMRSLLLAFAGAPMPARLVFVRREKRRLAGIRPEAGRQRK